MSEVNKIQILKSRDASKMPHKKVVSRFGVYQEAKY